MTMPTMQWAYLGRADYGRALELQEALKNQLSETPELPEALLLLEHPPVITLGRSANMANLLISDDERKRRGVSLYHVQRGGDVTYHGPGQLVGYPVRRIGRGVKPHVHAIIDALICFLDEYGVRSFWNEEHPGLWTSAGKIAAIGVDAQGGISTHGFALNISTNLDDYKMIVPCGLRAPVASLHQLIGPGRQVPSLAEAAQRLAPALIQRFESSAVEIEAEQMWRRGR